MELSLENLFMIIHVSDDDPNILSKVFTSREDAENYQIPEHPTKEMRKFFEKKDYCIISLKEKMEMMEDIGYEKGYNSENGLIF